MAGTCLYCTNQQQYSIRKSSGRFYFISGRGDLKLIINHAHAHTNKRIYREQTIIGYFIIIIILYVDKL